MANKKLFYRVVIGNIAPEKIRSYLIEAGCRVKSAAAYGDGRQGALTFQKEEDIDNAWTAHKTLVIEGARVELFRFDPRRGSAETEYPFEWLKPENLPTARTVQQAEQNAGFFLNPYNFVDVAGFTPRYAFTPHDRFTNNTGKITATLTLKTPGFIPDPDRTLYILSDDVVRHEEETGPASNTIAQTLENFMRHKAIDRGRLPIRVLFNPSADGWNDPNLPDNFIAKWTSEQTRQPPEGKESWVEGYIIALSEQPNAGLCLITSTPCRLGHKVMDFVQLDGKPIIPPTTLKGMLRSRIEILSNSCIPGLDDPSELGAALYQRIVPNPAEREIPPEIRGLKPVVLKRSGTGWHCIKVDQAKVLSTHLFDRIHNTGENKLAVYRNPADSCYEKISVRGTRTPAKGLYKYLEAKPGRSGAPVDISSMAEIETTGFQINRIQGNPLTHSKNTHNKTFAYMPWIHQKGRLWAIVRKAIARTGSPIYKIKAISENAADLDVILPGFQSSETITGVGYGVCEIRLKTSFDIDNKTQHRAFFIFGEKDLGEALETSPDADRIPLDQKKIATFNSLLRMRKENAKKLRRDPEGINPGLARLMQERAYDGMPAFYHPDNKFLTYTAIPQKPYRYSQWDLLERLGKLSCKDINRLCPACSMFGSAALRPPAGAEPGQKNRSLEGKISVSMGRMAGEKPPLQPFVTLKALSTPKPTYYPFYVLNNRGTRSTQGSFSDYDSGDARIGRKVYLHHRAETVNPQAVKRTKLNSTVRLIPPETTFSFDISFENLTNYELGLLIYALTAEYKGEKLAFHIGMGKSLGLGTCMLTMGPVQALQPAVRYSSINADGMETLSQTDIDKAVFVYQFVQGAEKQGDFRTRISQVNAGDLNGLRNVTLPAEDEITSQFLSKKYIKDYHILNSINRLGALRLAASICYAPGYEKGFEWYQEAKKDTAERLFEPENMEQAPQQWQTMALSRL